MPLDPHLAGVLQMMANSDAKPIHEGSPAEGRAAYLALTAGSLTPEQVVPVASIENTSVDGAAGPLKARIYRPEGDGPFPTVAFFHGGGTPLRRAEDRVRFIESLRKAGLPE
jgi:acetyl esterase